MKLKIGNLLRLFFTILIVIGALYSIGKSFDNWPWGVIVMAVLLIFYIWDDSTHRQIHG